MLIESLLTLFGLLLPAQDGGCRRCEHRGVVTCKKHDKEILEYEKRVLFCSEVAACSDCGGSLVIDCKHCEGGPDNAGMDARRAACQAWLRKDPLGGHLGRHVRHCDTEHFQLVVEAGTLKDGRKKVDPHVLMHRVADDCEHVAARINAHYGIGRKDYPDAMRMWIWSRSDDHSSVMQEFLHSSSTGDFKMLGKEPVFSVWTEPGMFSTVPAVRSLFTHNAGHMLLSNVFGQLWVGDLGGGWFDAGAGHWYEYDRFQRSVQYCIEEATAESSYHQGVWRAPIRKWLDREKEPVLPRLMPKNTGAMEVTEQALCWSFYDYLLARHPQKLRPVLEGLKAGKSGNKALEDALGVNVLGLERDWRAYVAKVYPKKGDEPNPDD